MRTTVVELEGSPYDMGRQHGQMLRDDIRALHGTWRTRMLKQTLGDTRGRDPSKGPIRDLDEFIEMLVDQSALWLPENLQEELRGLAQSSGVSENDLLRLEFMRDALRYMGMEAGLPGVVAARATATSVHGHVWWSGRDVSFVRRHLVLIRRKPDEGVETVTLAWPGALSGLAGIREDGLAFAHAQLPMRDTESSGFGGGQTFALAARVGLLKAANVGELFARIKGTVGHVLLALRHEVEPSWTRLEGIAGPALYAATAHTPLVISPRSLEGDEPITEASVAVGPFEDIHHQSAVALRAHCERDDLSLAAWFAACAVYVGGHAEDSFDGIHATIQSSEHIVSLSVEGGASVTLTRRGSSTSPKAKGDGKRDD